MEVEVWRVVAITGQHEVSNIGRVRSWASLGRNRGYPQSPRIMAVKADRLGYLKVGLRETNGPRHYRTVHSLVAEAFIGPRPEGMQVNHKNGIKTDNRVENLEYVTPTENIRHAFRSGLCDSRRGTRHYCNKLTECQVRDIIARQGVTSQRLLAIEHGVSKNMIQCIHRKKKWKHVHENLAKQQGVDHAEQ